MKLCHQKALNIPQNKMRFLVCAEKDASHLFYEKSWSRLGKAYT